MNTILARVLRHWIPLAITISMLCAIIYLVIQQDIRIGGYNPQIQMAEDMANTLNNGKSFTPSETIDISRSLSPFYIIFDKHQLASTSTGILNGTIPIPPAGVLTSSKGTSQPGENRLTWQPQANVRIATIVVKYNDGYVLVGRNMREIEIRIRQQSENIFIGWMSTLFVSLCSVFFVEIVFRKTK